MIINMSGGGSPGKIVTVHVTYGGAAGSGANVVCTNGKKTFYGITDSEGNAVFKLTKGGWTITADKNGSTSSLNVDVSGDCTVDISLFAATINVTYPAGCTCTATDGVTTLTAPDTSGTWKCVVHNSGTWTISASPGSSIATKNITDSDQNTSVVLDKYLFYQGNQYSGITGGWDASNVSNINAFNATPSLSISTNMTMKMTSSSSQARRGIVYAKKAINLSNYKTLLVTTGAVSGEVSVFVVNSVANGYNYNYLARSDYITGNKTITLDVSSISGSKYILFSVNALKDTPVSAVITKILLKG